jgi:hypothetical protein
VKRFNNVSVLKDDTPLLGATVKQWDDIFTGRLQATLDRLKHRVDEIRAANEVRHTGYVDDK